MSDHLGVPPAWAASDAALAAWTAATAHEDARAAGHDAPRAVRDGAVVALATGEIDDGEVVARLRL